MPNKPPVHRPPGAVAAKRATERRYAQTAARHEARAFYGSQLWRRTAAAFLQTHRLCVSCEKAGRLVVATVCDHVIPREQCSDPLDPENFQALCDACHNRKTAEEQKARRGVKR